MANQPIQQKPSHYSILSPLGQSSSSCGYCGSKSDSSISYGVWAHNLSSQTYQLMIDRGWRRSGSYLYLPDRAQTCCPPYAIKCSASSFHPSRSQRQTINRWKNFILSSPSKNHKPSTSSSSNPDKLQTPYNTAQIFNSLENIQEDKSNKHEDKIEIKLEPASFTEQKFELYKKYQMQVHNDPEEKVTKDSFKSFLCNNPFGSDSTVAKHANWIIKGEKLIAFSVLDFLELGISSVYFVWDPDFAKFGLGKLSALRELAWIQDWKSVKFGPLFDWYYLGFYIHSCPKMKYKGDYSPSFLLDPSSLKWEPLGKCVAKLEGGPRTENVIAFTNEENTKEQEEEFLVKVANRSGDVENISSSDERIKEAVEKLGSEILKFSIILI